MKFNFLKKIEKTINRGTGNITPENSSIEEVLEFKKKQKELEEYENSFDDNQAA